MSVEKSMYERMLAGELYIADDPALARDSKRAQRLTHLINTSDPTDHDRQRALLTELLGAFGRS
jgi:maltose O-acetyltransferase